MKNHTEIIWYGKLPDCAVCKRVYGIEGTAQFDARTVYSFWAYLCQDHYDQIGIGLGLGKGQKLIIRVTDEALRVNEE